MATERGQLTVLLEPGSRDLRQVLEAEGQGVTMPPWMADVEARLTRHETRQAWLNARSTGIGGSEAAVIMGASPWGSPYQLWQDKSGLAPVEDHDSEILRFGRVVEPHIAAEYERLTGRQLIHLGDWAIRQHASRSYMFATHDRIIAPIDARGPGVLSIKSANIWRGIAWEEEEEPPLAYQVQFQHELACSGFRWGSFAVLIWGKGVKWIDAERNDAFIAALEEECGDFWRRVLEGDPPDIDGSRPTSDALKRLYPKETGEVIELPPEADAWSAELEALDATLKTAEVRKEELRNRLKAAIGTASEGVVPGGPTWTLHVQSRKETMQAASEFRVLRRKGPKASKKGGK